MEVPSLNEIRTNVGVFVMASFYYISFNYIATVMIHFLIVFHVLLTIVKFVSLCCDFFFMCYSAPSIAFSFLPFLFLISFSLPLSVYPYPFLYPLFSQSLSFLCLYLPLSLYLSLCIFYCWLVAISISLTSILCLLLLRLFIVFINHNRQFT